VNDIIVENHGSIVLLRPVSPGAVAWLEENVASEPWQWTGGALACEPRTVGPVVRGLLEDGFTVQGCGL
jgi:hypothetical protein